MQSLLEFIVKNIVTHPDEVEINVSEETLANGNPSQVYNIHLNQEDIGIVVGKKGQTIRSIRSIAKVKAIKEKTYVDVRVIANDEIEGKSSE